MLARCANPGSDRTSVDYSSGENCHLNMVQSNLSVRYVFVAQSIFDRVLLKLYDILVKEISFCPRLQR